MENSSSENKRLSREFTIKTTHFEIYIDENEPNSSKMQPRLKISMKKSMTSKISHVLVMAIRIAKDICDYLDRWAKDSCHNMDAPEPDRDVLDDKKLRLYTYDKNTNFYMILKVNLALLCCADILFGV